MTARSDTSPRPHRRPGGEGVVRLGSLAVVPLLAWLLSLAGCFSGCDGTDLGLTAEPGEQFSGGDVTVFNAGQNAFGLPAPGLSNMDAGFFGVGNSFFNQNWVTAPASTTARDGLGPFFNARSCAGCHFKDGRGRTPTFDGERVTGFLVRVAIPGQRDAFGSPLGDERYGSQIQDQATLDFAPEATVLVDYEEIAGQFADGTPYSLRRPIISFEDEAYGPITGLTLSPRVANQMPGMGLLDAIPEADLLALADPDDADGDGISGRLNMVWNVREQRHTPGRFGWKAAQPTVEQQVASAFHGDLGITTSLFDAENCTVAPAGCNEAPTGGSPEVEDRNLAHVTLYSSTLAVPARRDWEEPDVLRGKALFKQIGCAGCHLPVLRTGPSEVHDVLSGQTIRPYTDLLLHDMGEGLADGMKVFEATGREWRTPPLWGLGLIQTVNRHTELLHDGRARNVTEAILWHGGEAEAAKERFRHLSRAERDDLLRFLNSL
ncbi:MAG: di-heme oxidoredictase family protein [Bacteroidota bacterium]